MLTSAPRLIKAGLVEADAETLQVIRVIPMQYNPTKLGRSLQPRTTSEIAGRSEALRLTGAPIETISIEAVIDATDGLERGDPLSGEAGIAGHLAALELLTSPDRAQLLAVDRQAQRGVLEVLPMQQPLTLLVWGKNRIVPVRIAELGVTEEAFDPALNPIRATVTLSLRVLTVDDLGFAGKGGQIFLNHLATKEKLARRMATAGLDTLGIGALL